MENPKLYIEELKKAFGDKEYFQIADLHAFYQSFEASVPKSTVNWRIYALVKEDVIQRIGRGTYKCGSGNNFLPQLPLFKIFDLAYWRDQCLCATLN